MSLPVTGMAGAAGMQQAAAMVALGAFAAATRIVKIETLHAIAAEILPPYRQQFAAANRRALTHRIRSGSGSLCPLRGEDRGKHASATSREVRW